MVARHPRVPKCEHTQPLSLPERCSGLKLSLQFCVSSELILMWQGTPPAEGKGAVRQGVIGRRLDSMSRLKAACGPWDPNLGTVTEMFQRVECGQVGPQRLEGGWDAFAQQIDCPF